MRGNDLEAVPHLQITDAVTTIIDHEMDQQG